MDQIGALKELAAKVEDGTWDMSGFMPEQDLEILKNTEIFSGYISELISVVENGSLDAAHSLHKAVLGDRWIPIVNIFDTTVDMLLTGKGHLTSFAVDSTSPSRAWLLAIIKAKISELENE